MKPRRVAGGNFSFRLKGFVLNIFLDQEWLHQISSSGLKPDSAWLPNTATQECQLNLNFNLTSTGWISCENCQGLLQFLDQSGSGSWPPALPAKFVHACRAVCYSFPSLHSFADVVTAAIVVQVFTSIYKILQVFTHVYKYLQVAKVSRVMTFSGLKEVQGLLWVSPWSICSIRLARQRGQPSRPEHGNDMEWECEVLKSGPWCSHCLSQGPYERLLGRNGVSQAEPLSIDIRNFGAETYNRKMSPRLKWHTIRYNSKKDWKLRSLRSHWIPCESMWFDVGVWRFHGEVLSESNM